MKMKTIKQWMILTITALVMLVFPVSAVAELSSQDLSETTTVTTSVAASDAMSEDYSLVQEIIDILNKYHLDDVSEEQLIEAAIEGILESLGDPYTDYMTAEEWDDYHNSIEQHFVGIGIRLGQDEYGVFALDVFPDTPASEAGIARGDYIVAIDGRTARNKSTDEIVAMIAGEEGTDVDVMIERNGEEKTFTMTRRQVSIPNVENKWFAQNIGYVKISMFSTDADEKFEEYMTKMKASGVEGLVIDLRDNPGGYLDTVGYIAGEFIKEGILMETRNKLGPDLPIKIYNGKQVDVPVVILINEYSASGSEVLAGALQDHNLATIIGVRSFGKGNVQSIIPLSNGGVLKTTVQEYLTPNGKPVHGNGITPDIEVQGRIPQLLTALRKVGLDPLTITASSKETIVNDVNFNDVFNFEQHDGRVYVHSRVLAAMADYEVYWEGENGQIVFASDRDVHVFAIDSPEVLLRPGMSLIDLDSFAEKLGNFDWVYDDQQLTMTISNR